MGVVNVNPINVCGVVLEAGVFHKSNGIMGALSRLLQT